MSQRAVGENTRTEGFLGSDFVRGDIGLSPVAALLSLTLTLWRI